MSVRKTQKGEFEGLIRLFKGCVANSVKGMKPIYVDTNYWIYLLEARLGRARNENHNGILSKMLKLKAAGSIFCPISDAIFMEVSRQSDENTRIPTAQLMDELSGGIAIETTFQRAENEIEYSIAAKAGNRDFSVQVWTKPCFAFGDVLLKDDTLSEEQNTETMTAYLTKIWNISFKQMLSMVPNGNNTIYQDYNRVAEELNKNAKQHESEVTSFDTAYEIEFIGIGSVFRECFLRNISSNIDKLPIAQKAIGVTETKSIRAKSYPTLHIGALCHAAVRWDKKRQIKGNDILDFFHASAAIPYCDAFLTDRSLKHTLTSGKFDSIRQFSCQILSHDDEVLRYLNGLE